jgi:uncharacterized membrane protein YkvA (DUF1232 family)
MKISPKAIYNWYGKTLRHPKYRWWIILGTLLYFLSPLDISPDVIPIAGQLDDFVLLTLMFTEVSQIMVEYLKNKPSQDNLKDTQTEAKTTIDVDAVSLD